MRFKTFVTGAAAAAMALAPVAVQAAPGRAGAEMTEANQISEDGTIAIIFGLTVIVLGIFATSDNDNGTSP